MPAPIFKGDAATWTQQRGTTFGTKDEGNDWIDLVYRGKSESAVIWRTQWTKGTTCPEPGFSHCKLIKPPEFQEDNIAFSTATLHFEGQSPLSGTVEGSDATIPHETQEAEFIVYYAITKEGGDIDNSEGVYRYHRNVMTATYTKASQPTSTRYDSDLNKDPDPVPIADVKLGPGAKRFDKLVKGNHYRVGEPDAVWHIIKDWTETAPGVFDVTEEHSKFIIGNHVDIDQS